MQPAVSSWMYLCCTAASYDLTVTGISSWCRSASRLLARTRNLPSSCGSSSNAALSACRQCSTCAQSTAQLTHSCCCMLALLLQLAVNACTCNTCQWRLPHRTLTFCTCQSSPTPLCTHRCHPSGKSMRRKGPLVPPNCTPYLQAPAHLQLLVHWLQLSSQPGFFLTGC